MKLKTNINKSIDSYLKKSYSEVINYERFHFLYKKIQNKLFSGIKILDIGCAKGEFFYYLLQKQNELKLTGIEKSEELVKIARNFFTFPNVRFIKADARSFKINDKYDIALMIGVLSIFDDFESPLNTMINHLKKNGSGYIFGGFNQDDIDVIVRFRNNYAGSKIWESGWNMFSLETIKKFLNNRCYNIKSYKFNLSLDLAKDKNPVKSYTLTTKEKGKIILTGGNILRDFYLIEFQKNE